MPGFHRPARHASWAGTKCQVHGSLVHLFHMDHHARARLVFWNIVGKRMALVISIDVATARRHDLGPVDGEAPAIGEAPAAIQRTTRAGPWNKGARIPTEPIRANRPPDLWLCRIIIFSRRRGANPREY